MSAEGQAHGRILVIETATSVCSLALFGAGAQIASRHEHIGRGHAERLIPMIAELPDGGRAAQIIVGCGPGSFTGIRVGVAAARALGLGWGAGVSGYATTALTAARAFADEPGIDSIVVALAGGHGELFVQSFVRAPFDATSALGSMPPQSAAKAMHAPHVAGSGAEVLVAARGYGTVIAAEPAAADVWLLPHAFTQLPPAPLYARGADATPLA